MDDSSEEPILEQNSLISEHQQPSVSAPAYRGKILLEPPVLLLNYAFFVSSAVLTDQLIYQACTVSFGVNKSECAQLGKEHESADVQALEARVQPYTANILMVESMINSILPAVLNLFIGPWSDRFGRRPVLLATFIGCLLSYLLDTVICFLSSQYMVNPWFYFITCIPMALTGSICTLMTTVYCYIADVTDEQNRSTKMAILEAVQYSGMLLGNLSSSYLLRMTNATTVFAVSTGSVSLAVLYIACRVQESVVLEEAQRRADFCTKVRYLFRPDLVLDTFKTTFSSRGKHNRAIILMGIVAVGANFFVYEENYTILFLFMRKQFNWGVRKFTMYNTANTIFLIVGNLLGSYVLQKRLGLTESGIAAIGFYSAFLDSLVKAVATESWQLYLAVTLCLLKGVSDPMSRAFVSNAAPPEDIGKIFALSSTFEELVPLAAAPLYTLVYKQTLPWYPGAYNWISCGIYAFCYSLAMTVCVLQSMQKTTGYR
ncbi:proton-coupled folate transporter-like [Wyeomyia smithii]|uniref:proton-coupled folate transporter-like n=1 Tax=Wyeomyia smithii TaxID=174621 RepID=UPI00246811D0|nr:proton-coupled folate transporter-like [Wyeomyia smithii]